MPVSITIDILHKKALDLIRELENIKWIKVRNNNPPEPAPKNWRGSLKKESLKKVQQQLDELRTGWE